MTWSNPQKVLGPDSTTATLVSSFTLSGLSAVGSGNALTGLCEYAASAEQVPTSINGVAAATSVLDHYFDAANGNGAFTYFVPNVTNGATTVVFTWASAVVNYLRAQVVEWHNTAGAITAVDTHVAAATTSATPSPYIVSSGATATLAASGEALYGAIAQTNGGFADVFTPQGSFTLANNGSAGPDECIADATQFPYASTTGIAFTCQVNNLGLHYYTAIVALALPSSGSNMFQDSAADAAVGGLGGTAAVAETAGGVNFGP